MTNKVYNYNDLTGKVAIVTGASRGLGQYMARALARAGADLIVTSRKKEDCQPPLDEIQQNGNSIEAFSLDVSQERSIDAFSEAVLTSICFNIPMRIFSILSVLFVLAQTALAEVSIRETLILTSEEQNHLRQLIQNNEEAQKYWMPIREEAQSILTDQPNPLKVIHYEGLLDTDPKRVKTEQSLQDMDKLAVFLFAFYGTQDAKYAERAKDYILAWADAYEATGNPINENKLEPLIHSYQVMKDFFSQQEKEGVNRWLAQMAEAEVARDDIPENNWKAKHIKLVGTIGLVLQKQEYIQYAIDQYKKYVDKALYGDGTSRDLHHRDALSYHVSGLDPLLTFGITLEQFAKNLQYDPFRYENPQGGSVKKSVDFVVPYAKGEKEYAQWVNTQVELDRQRAQAGLEHYQPGKLFEPESALDTFELAYYFDRNYKEVLQVLAAEEFHEYSSWFLLLVNVAREIE